MLKCNKASRLISEALDRRLSLRERLPLRIHLFLCGMCAAYRQELRALRGLLKIWNKKVAESLPALPQESRERIKTRLREASS